MNSVSALVLGSALVATSCLTPPCNCAQVNAPSAGATESTAATTSAPAPAGATSDAAARKVIWDGDEVGAGAKSWADCDKKPDCKGTLAAEASVGRNDSVGLKFTGQGPGWIGGGWNLFGWYPPNAGHDVSGYTHMSLWVRIEAKTPELAPDLGVLLACSSNPKKGQSETLFLSKNSKENVLDGQWHEVVLPLADFKTKSEFDPKTVWEVGFTQWSQTPKEFTVYVDDIVFEKR
ncbi:MAG TPA: hypothetical protein VIM73_21150 [Polyangiaceae bacterium]